MQKIKEFFRDVIAETKKVVYPKKAELFGATWVVVISVIIMSVYLGVVDLGLSELVKTLLK